MSKNLISPDKTDIEIHGADKERAERIRDKIFEIFDPLKKTFDKINGYYHYLSVSIFYNSVRDYGERNIVITGAKEGRTPFFRVYYTSKKVLKIILKELHHFDIDIQIIQKMRYIPRYNHDQDPSDRLEVPYSPRYEDT